MSKHARPRYDIIVWKRSGLSHDIAARFMIGRNRSEAMARARKLAGFIEATRYTASRELRNADFCEVRAVHRHLGDAGRRGYQFSRVCDSTFVQPEVRYVPSVGELGWTP